LRPELVRELASLVDEPTAAELEKALAEGGAVVALTIEERERILRALDDPSERLAELRGVLLREHEGRKRVGRV
jgi:hypothetical protein